MVSPLHPDEGYGVDVTLCASVCSHVHDINSSSVLFGQRWCCGCGHAQVVIVLGKWARQKEGRGKWASEEGKMVRVRE